MSAYADYVSPKTSLLPTIEAARDGRVSNEYVGILFRRWIDTGERLYTAQEVGDFQYQEAELVARPLRAENKRLRRELDDLRDGQHPTHRLIPIDGSQEDVSRRETSSATNQFDGKEVA